MLTRKGRLVLSDNPANDEAGSVRRPARGPRHMARGSTTPASASGIDWQRLRRFLGDRGMALAEHPEPRRFPGGFGNLNYLLTVDGTAMVLRRPPFGEVPIGANDMGDRKSTRLHSSH